MTEKATELPSERHDPDHRRQEDIRTWLQLVKTVLPMEREINRLFAREFGQSLARFDVLAQLHRIGTVGIAVGPLAEQLIASAGNITHLLSRMEREGLIRREAAARDRRSQIVRITDDGRRLYQDMAALHDGWASTRIGTLSDHEKDGLQRLLRALRSRPGADRPR